MRVRGNPKFDRNDIKLEIESEIAGRIPMRGARPLLTELRGYADMIHCNCAGSRFISFSIVGRAIDTDVEFAVWKRKLTT